MMDQFVVVRYSIDAVCVCTVTPRGTYCKMKWISAEYRAAGYKGGK